ncbi:MAG TPA: acetyltransferase, partial [Bacteroidales bacterium]
SALVYSDVRKIKRGYYESTIVMMTDRPNEMPDFEITELYARLMEKTIQRDPAYWLWTHKRWKHKHEVNSGQ